MDRLSRYIARQFFTQALTIFAAGGVLIWLMQLLRLFDLVSAQGQSFLTLMGQSALSTPTYARAILYVCFAIGLVRGLRALEASRELHTLHAAQRTGALWRAIAMFTLVGMLAVTAISHWLEPAARDLSAQWSARIAADVVERALSPGRFSEIEDGLVVSIGGRRADGTLTDFFLDDATAPETRRTYFAQSARVFQDDNGYQLILNDGAIQYEGADRRGLSQIAFAQYHISLSNLIDSVSTEAGLDQVDSLTLATRLSRGEAGGRAVDLLYERSADAVRALALCVLVMGLAAFPSGRRHGARVPLELVILLIAFGEQAVSAFSGGGGRFLIAPTVILMIGLLVFWRRTARAQFRPHRQRRTA